METVFVATISPYFGLYTQVINITISYRPSFCDRSWCFICILWWKKTLRRIDPKVPHHGGDPPQLKGNDRWFFTIAEWDRDTRSSTQSQSQVWPWRINLQCLDSHWGWLYIYIYTWVFPKIMVPPKSSILIGFSIIFTIHFGAHPYFWKHPYIIKTGDHNWGLVCESLMVPTKMWG